jgi:hypothetical protein
MKFDVWYNSNKMELLLVHAPPREPYSNYVVNTLSQPTKMMKLMNLK